MALYSHLLIIEGLLIYCTSIYAIRKNFFNLGNCKISLRNYMLVSLKVLMEITRSTNRKQQPRLCILQISDGSILDTNGTEKQTVR